ncbi:uncharacterized protein ACRADG_006109 [Cochliomyia hominivorax]
MSNDLCSPFNCNICLMLTIEKPQKEENPLKLLQLFPYLLTCSGCQLIKYCNREHQKLDWPLHREFCLSIQKIKEKFNVTHPFYLNGGTPKSKRSIEKCIIRLKFLLKNSLQRNLEYYEEELSSFPAYCGQCFEFRKLKSVCEKCVSQPYCTEEHKETNKQRHEQVCGLLKLYYCPFKVVPLTEDLDLKLREERKDLIDLNLVAGFEKIFSVKLPEDPCKSLKDYHLFAFASDFSCIMSICYAMEHLRLESENVNKLSIFILGASVEAVLWFRDIHCKIFFLQNPKILKLELNFIGPEVVETQYKEMKFKFLGQERLVKLSFYQGLFQDYCKYNPIQPNLIVAFNCGFSEFSERYNFSPKLTNLNALDTLDDDIKHVNAKDTWFEGLIEILQIFDTPIIFTSFTEQESKFDFGALQMAAHQQPLKVLIKPVLKVSKNPYHDLRPLRQWYTSDNEEFYYRNGYIQAITAKLEK